MKKVLLLLIILVAGSLYGEKIYYSDGSDLELKISKDFSAVKADKVSFKRLANEVMRFDLGERIYSVVSGDAGDMPVYFIKDFPVVADNLLFWRGEKSVAEMERKYDMKLVEIKSGYKLYAFRVNSSDSVKTAQKIVENGDGYSFPNLVREMTLRSVPAAAPEDPYFNMQWHLHNDGSPENYYGDLLKAKKGADVKFLETLEFLNGISYEVDDTIKVAIMDTGIAPDHEDLTNIEPGWDMIEDKEGGYPDPADLEGISSWEVGAVAHGTTCAGVSAAEGNELGMSGVCPWCQLYPVRYLNGLTGTASDDNKMLAIYEKYVADPKISVINCSFGPPSDYGYVPTTPGEVESIQNFMENGRDGLGGVVVYAAGNDGVDAGYARLMTTTFEFQRDGKDVENEVVTVAASNGWDVRAVYSNYGPSIDIIAPSLGQNPLLGMATTTIPGYGDYKDDYTLIFSGTSAAAPVVSGFFGTVFSINPDLTLEEAIEIMHQSSDKIYPETGSWDEDGHSVKFGHGRVNLLKAVRLAMDLPLCDEPAAEETCGNNIDDDCDGYVDEECSDPLLVGTECESIEDCINGDLTEKDVYCMAERKYWVFKGGYCTRLTNEAPCPDGTKPFDYADDGENYICAAECSKVNGCERPGYYCSNDVLGVCLPKCSRDSDCREGSYCNVNAECAKIPSDIGGSCQDDDECADNGWCIPPYSFSEGYCTADCANEDDSYCPENSRCVRRKTGQGQNIDICLSSCSSDEECRGGDDFYICHARLTGKEGICFRTCRDDSDCMDIDASCNEDGRCVPDDWQGWPEDEVSDETDEDNLDADEETADEETDNEVSDDDEKEKKSDGCSLITI